MSTRTLCCWCQIGLMLFCASVTAQEVTAPPPSTTDSPPSADKPAAQEAPAEAPAPAAASAAAPAPAPTVTPTVSDSWIKALEWRPIGPANMSGRVVDVEVYEKDPCMYYVATASGGLLKTINNGMTFEHQFDHEAVVSIGDVALSQSDPNIVWVGTGENNPRNSVSFGNGVYKSTDGGKTWAHMGLEGTFQIGRMVVHPENPEVVYVGALGRLYGPNEDRGLYKTTDGGKTWQKVLYIDDKTGVIDLRMHPSQPDTLLVATYDRSRDGFDSNDPARKFGLGAGMYRTTDGGATFEKLTQGLPSVAVGRIGLDYYRKDPNVVFAIVESELIAKEGENVGWAGVVGENSETGAKITKVIEEGPAAKAGIQAGDIVLSVNDETVLSYEQFASKFYGKEIGEKFVLELARKGKAEKIEVALDKRVEKEDASREQRAQFREEMGANDSFSSGLGGQQENIEDRQGKKGHEHGGVYKSTDGGTTWTRMNSVNPRPMYFSQIRVDPSDLNFVYVLGISFYESKDGGDTFQEVDARAHPDHHALWVDPRDGRHLLLGNDGGFYVSWDRGQTWDHHNHFAIGQFYHVAVDSRRDYMVAGGLQDNGSWAGPSRVRNGSGPINEDWLSVGGGDGFVTAFDGNDPDVVYFESQNGGIGRRNLRTGESGFLRPPRAPKGVNYRFNWKTPFILSNHNSRIYYTAANYVFRSLDRGNDLRTISPEITLTDKGSATALAESPLNPEVLYAGTDDGALWLTQNGGRDWTRLFNPPAPAPEAPKVDERVIGSEQTGGAAVQSSSSPAVFAGLGGGVVSSIVTSLVASTEASLDEDPKALSGDWEAEIESEEIPQGGEFKIVWTVAADGSLSGSVHSRMGDSTIESGKVDLTNGNFSFVSKSSRGEATFQGKVTGNKMSGELVVMNGQLSMEFTARKAGATVPTEPPASPPAEGEGHAPPAEGQPAATQAPPAQEEPKKEGEKPAPAEGEQGEEKTVQPTPGGKPLHECIPGPRWVATIEASRFEESRVYLCLDAHRSDDDEPYLFVSEDFGATWRSIRSNLPKGSSRTLREDRFHADILYAGTEFATFVSIDRGETWTKLNNNLPTVAVHELAQHPTSGEIVAATHGRSLWVLDVSPLRQLTKDVLAEKVHLFKPNDVVLWRNLPSRGSTARRFTGDNPAAAAQFFYSLKEKAKEIKLRVENLSGETLRELEASLDEGMHKVTWDLRRQQQPDQGQGPPVQGQASGQAPGQGRQGRFGRRGGGRMEQGTYKVVLLVDGATFTQTFKLETDPSFLELTIAAEEDSEELLEDPEIEDAVIR